MKKNKDAVFFWYYWRKRMEREYKLAERTLYICRFLEKMKIEDVNELMSKSNNEIVPKLNERGINSPRYCRAALNNLRQKFPTNMKDYSDIHIETSIAGAEIMSLAWCFNIEKTIPENLRSEFYKKPNKDMIYELITYYGFDEEWLEHRYLSFDIALDKIKGLFLNFSKEYDVELEVKTIAKE